MRRPPPPFRRATAVAAEPLGGWLASVRLSGPEMAGLEVTEPAASVRLLLPVGDRLTLPTWTGNEFLLPDGTRPPIRTLTPVEVTGDPEEPTLTVEVVLGDHGPLARWAASVLDGDPPAGGRVAVSDPGRGYRFDPDARRLVILADESATPAARQLVGWAPPSLELSVHVETGRGPVPFPARDRCTLRWWEPRTGEPPGARLVEAAAGEILDDATRLWAAGEAAAMQRIRRLLFTERGHSRRVATVRGYWKAGRAGDDDGD